MKKVTVKAKEEGEIIITLPTDMNIEELLRKLDTIVVWYMGWKPKGELEYVVD